MFIGESLDLGVAERRVLGAMQAITRHLVATAKFDDVIMRMQAKNELKALQERLSIEIQYYELIAETALFAELTTDRQSVVYH